MVQENKTSGKKLLVVEDDLILLRILSDELIGAGFKIMEAKDGETAYALALKEHPDLILLDIVLPQLDGLAVMNRLRRDDWGRDVPIIIFTVVDPDDSILRIIERNKPAFYLVKSKWKLEDVIKKVKEVLFP